MGHRGCRVRLHPRRTSVLSGWAAEAEAAADVDMEARIRTALTQGRNLAEANREARRATRAARDAQQATLNPLHHHTLAPGEDGETLVHRFACETHDAPGACTRECAELVDAMNPSVGDDFTYDPSGCHDGPERPYDTYDYDPATRASICTTHVPEHQVLAYTVQPGQDLFVDGQPRTVDTVTASGRYKVFIDFDGHTHEYRVDDVLSLAD